MSLFESKSEEFDSTNISKTYDIIEVCKFLKEKICRIPAKQFFVSCKPLNPHILNCVKVNCFKTRVKQQQQQQQLQRKTKFNSWVYLYDK